MALNQRKWQKKVEKRNAKQKAKKKELAIRKREEPILRMERAGAAPVLHSEVSASLSEQGIGYLLLSRQLASGNVASALFLVDVYCLGVKDVICRIAPEHIYEMQIHNKLRSGAGLRQISPESLRKLVEGAVAYARDLGIEPHGDYQLARLLFGDIDAGRSTEEFQYGKDGKPLFISGPYDSPEKCGRIMNLLMDRCGPGKFDYVVHVGSDENGMPQMQSLMLEEDEEDGSEDRGIIDLDS